MLLIALAALTQPVVGAIYQDGVQSPFPAWRLFFQGGSEDGAEAAVFANRASYAIARVESVSREGVRPPIWRVDSVTLATAQPGEEAYSGESCQLLDRSPVLVFYSPASRVARGYFVSRSGTVAQRWIVGPDQTCEDAGD